MLRIIAVSLFAVFLTPPATAEVDYSTIGGMRSASKSLLEDVPDVTDLFLEGYCLGWIVSEMNIRTAVCYGLVDRPNFDWGAYASLVARNLDGHAPAAAARGFVNWANDNPHLWSEKVSFVAFQRDFLAEFPCEYAN